ncbi:hypothetical protein ACFP3Q_08470 [Nocardioides sp. GCM10027113]|uniref:hypothetical protein n=1 Tax=unclassified Nocardioides TaxID=2615069 RepID=UPI003612FA73
MSEHKTAGAFDVRNIIGALMGLYGVILTLMGLFGDNGDVRTADINSNLWAGLALLVVGAIFIAWWRLRPIAVPEEPAEREAEPAAQSGQ